MGSWITFNVGEDRRLRDQRAEVLRVFFARGGRVIDCSPMYGTSAEVIGYGLDKIGRPRQLFSTAKVWTWLQSDGPEQMEEQRAAWVVQRFALLQVHNLLNWAGPLVTLTQWKDEGHIRSPGLTPAHGSRHNDMAAGIKEPPQR